MNRLLAVLLLSAAVAFPQATSFGVKGGVPLTKLLQTGSTPAGETITAATTNRYIAGASVEGRLGGRFSLEFDALYRHVNYRGYRMSPAGRESEHVTAGDWELPLLLKYRIAGGRARPYVSAGVALDALGITNSFADTVTNTPYPSTTTGTNSTPAALQGKAVFGLVVGCGVDLKAGRLHVSPEIRFTNWTTPHFSNSNRNQAEFLLGLSF